MAIKYSDEQLTKAVEESSSVAGVLRRLRFLCPNCHSQV